MYAHFMVRMTVTHNQKHNILNTISHDKLFVQSEYLHEMYTFNNNTEYRNRKYSKGGRWHNYLNHLHSFNVCYQSHLQQWLYLKASWSHSGTIKTTRSDKSILDILFDVFHMIHTYLESLECPWCFITVKHFDDVMKCDERFPDLSLFSLAFGIIMGFFVIFFIQLYGSHIFDKEN